MNKRAWRVGLGVVLVAVSSACSSTKGANEAESSATPADTGEATAAPTGQAVAPRKQFKVALLEVDDDGLDQDVVNSPEPTVAKDATTSASSVPRVTVPERAMPHPPPTTEAGDSGTGPKGPQRVGAAQSTSAAGQMSRENIESALDKSEATFGQCADTSSTFSARVVVSPNGSVSEARVTQSVPDDPRLRDCLTEALRRLSFPPTNAPVPLSFSLAIEPV